MAHEKKGYGIIPTWIMKANLSHKAKLILMCLACYAGDKDYCYPSISTICSDLKIGRTTAINILKKAEEKKFIKIEKLYPGNPFKKHNKYTLLFKNGSSICRTTGSPNAGPPEVPMQDHEKHENPVPMQDSRSPNAGLSKSQCRTENININIITEKDLQKTRENDLKKLKQITLEIFKKISPEQFKTKNDFAREGSAIKKFCEDAVERFKDFNEQKKWVEDITDIYRKICFSEIKHKWLNDSVFIPSRMRSKGIWPEVVNALKEKRPKNKKMPDYSSYKED
jgi:hypothetical protein